MGDLCGLARYIARQRSWSRRVFGHGRRTGGLAEHIRKELVEIAEHPTDLLEWIDVVILALDGAWRAGYTPDEIVAALEGKQQANMARQWPAPVSEDMPVEHVKETDQR